MALVLPASRDLRYLGTIFLRLIGRKPTVYLAVRDKEERFLNTKPMSALGQKLPSSNVADY